MCVREGGERKGGKGEREGDFMPKLCIIITLIII